MTSGCISIIVGARCRHKFYVALSEVIRVEGTDIGNRLREKSG